MALTGTDVQAICEYLRREGVFPEAYKNRDFGGISLAQRAEIIAAAADASGADHEHYEELRQMAQTLAHGAEVRAAQGIPESYSQVSFGDVIAFYPPPGDVGGKVKLFAK